MVPRNGSKRGRRKETRAHLEARILRTKPEVNQGLRLTPRIAALGSDAFEQGPVMIKMIHAYLVKELNRVLLGENLPNTFSIFDKGIPPSSSGSINR